MLDRRWRDEKRARCGRSEKGGGDDDEGLRILEAISEPSCFKLVHKSPGLYSPRAQHGERA